MRRFKAIGLVGVLLLAGSLSVRADVWDVGNATDNVPAETRNELMHGSDQVHDMAARGSVIDEDWFLLSSEPYSSYTIVVDGTTADVVLDSGNMSRRDFNDPNTNLQSSFGAPAGASRTLSFANAGGTTVFSYLRIAGCGVPAACDATDQYRIRMFDTTYLVPRFNNANSQVTVLLMQNSLGGSPVLYTAHYWSVSGTLLASVPGTIPARESAVINLSTIPALQNQTGTIIITHNAGYGGLAVKSVALQPSTGFSFDTPGTYRHR